MHHLINSQTFRKIIEKSISEGVLFLSFWVLVKELAPKGLENLATLKLRSYSKICSDGNLWKKEDYFFRTRIITRTKMFSEEFQTGILKFWPPKVRKSFGSILWRELNISRKFARCVGVSYTSSVCSQRDDREQVLVAPLETIFVFFL